MSTIVLYERERAGVRVQALQTRGEDNKCTYKVLGYKDGELVKEVEVEGGYRPQAGAARKLFKDMLGEFGPAKEPKAPKGEPRAPKIYTPEQIAADVAKAERRLARLREIQETLPVVEAAEEAQGQADPDQEAAVAE